MLWPRTRNASQCNLARRYPGPNVGTIKALRNGDGEEGAVRIAIPNGRLVNTLSAAA
jgi:hypothetical protein